MGLGSPKCCSGNKLAAPSDIEWMDQYISLFVCIYCKPKATTIIIDIFIRCRPIHDIERTIERKFNRDDNYDPFSRLAAAAAIPESVLNRTDP